MPFEDLAAFFAMGGHGLYVWLAYGATFAVLLGYRWTLRRMRRRLMFELDWEAAAAREETAPHAES